MMEWPRFLKLKHKQETGIVEIVPTLYRCGQELPEYDPEDTQQLYKVLGKVPLHFPNSDVQGIRILYIKESQLENKQITYEFWDGSKAIWKIRTPTPTDIVMAKVK